MSVENLCAFLRRYDKVTALTGAGCSTGSGIPAYRNDAGDWRHAKPMLIADFVADPGERQRYWARSFAGWLRVSRAVPNPAHVALAELEQAGRINALITQNVDGLHRAAGSRNVIDLHGALDRIRCLGCGRKSRRSDFQQRLAGANPDWSARAAASAPDGDAALDAPDCSRFHVPACSECGGVLKPDVVFFGEAVPADRVQRATLFVQQSDALLVAGSSLMVFSGFRFARIAHACGKPIAIINRGKTRADGLATCRMAGDCGTLLAGAVASITEEACSHARSVDRNL